MDSKEPDEIKMAAQLALAHARTARVAGYLLDQYRGALSEELKRIDSSLAAGQRASAEWAIRALLNRAEFGLHLTTPWRVVLAGRPNAGKSSLMNAIVGYERSIVFDQPGTTRDVLSASTALDGWPVDLFDTAGLSKSSHHVSRDVTPAIDPVEAEGVQRASRQVASADIVLFVSENTAEWDQTMLGEVQSAARRLLVVHNKSDVADVPRDGRPEGLSLSALHGDGIESLCRAIVERLLPDIPPRGAAIPFTEVQVGILKQQLKRQHH
jgi:tRNA modification GTPase